MKYGQFILLVRRICRTAGRDLGLKTTYAVEISLISVAIVSIGFISEAILCVEYMQGTRLALIKAEPAISALFALFSVMKCKFIFVKPGIIDFSVFLLWVKWLFWLRRWKEVLHVYIHKLELDLIPTEILIYNSLSIIMGIILHDVLQKTIKIFYFSRFKPSSLQFTSTQLLSASMDTLLGLWFGRKLSQTLGPRVTLRNKLYKLYSIMYHGTSD